MIAELIYNGSTAEDLNMPERSYLSRKETLDRFLSTGPKLEDFEAEYRKWLPTDIAGMTIPDKIVVEERLPTLITRAKNLVVSSSQHIVAGMPIATKEEAARRWDICQKCPRLMPHPRSQSEEKTHCSLCGCSMEFKSTWLEQPCRAGKW